MGLVRKQGRITAAISSQSEKEEIDVDEQFETSDLVEKGWLDQSEGMWLSSGCLSPSLLSFDGQEFRDICDLDYPLSSWTLVSDEQDLSMNDQFSPVLPVSESSGFFFDGSRISPIEEASLVLDRKFSTLHLQDPITLSSESVSGAKTIIGGTEKDCEDDLQSEVGTWLYNSLSSNVNDSSITCSEGTGAFELSISEDSSVLESSWTSLSIIEDSSLIHDVDRTGVWVSLLDLDDKDFEWVSDKEQELDIFQSDIPSPSYKTKRNFEAPCRNFSRFSVDADGSQILPRDSSSCSVPLLSDEKSCLDFHFEQAVKTKGEVLCSGTRGDSECFDSDEPLFWPFDPNSYWHAEIEWDCHCISPPCKNRGQFVMAEGFCNPKSVKLKLPERKKCLLQKKKRNIIQNCDRKYSWNKRGTMAGSSSEPFLDNPGCARKLVFSSRSTMSTVLDSKTGYENNSFGRISTISSRVNGVTKGLFQQNSFKIPKKQAPLKTKSNSAPITNEVRTSVPSHSRLPAHRQPSLYNNKMKGNRNLSINPVKLRRDNKKTLVLPLFGIPAKDYQEFLAEGFGSNESSIESLVGMSEFDGHEGIDAGFNKDQFSLDESLFENLMALSLRNSSSSDFSEASQSPTSITYSALDWSLGSGRGEDNETSSYCSLGFSQSSVEVDDCIVSKDEGEASENGLLSELKSSELCKWFCAFKVHAADWIVG